MTRNNLETDNYSDLAFGEEILLPEADQIGLPTEEEIKAYQKIAKLDEEPTVSERILFEIKIINRMLATILWILVGIGVLALITEVFLVTSSHLF